MKPLSPAESRSTISIAPHPRMALAWHEHDTLEAPGALDAQAAIDIFTRKKTRVSRDATTAELAARYNITMKAVRDVWNMRTWVKTTMPYWDQSDLKTFLGKHLCTA